jgi:Aldo/keto reductase family
VPTNLFCRLEMALAPWNVLAGGKFRTDEEEEKRQNTGEKGQMFEGFSPEWLRDKNERTSQPCSRRSSRAGRRKAYYFRLVDAWHVYFCMLTIYLSVAIAYLMQKAPYVFPIVGGRKVEHLLANLEALDISLDDEQMVYLESIIALDLGFPSTFIVGA